MEPYLDTSGRSNYKQALIEIYREVLDIEQDFDDQGRLRRVKQGIGEALVDLNNIAMCKNENRVWDDRNVGLQY